MRVIHSEPWVSHGGKRWRHVTFVRMENDGASDFGRQLAQTFGVRVRSLRSELGWTQEFLAQMMTAYGYPMHQSTVAKMEAGARPTSVEELGTLAMILRVPAGALLDLSTDAQIQAELAAHTRRINQLGAQLHDLRSKEAAVRVQHEEAQELYRDARMRLEQHQAIEEQAARMERESEQAQRDYEAYKAYERSADEAADAETDRMLGK